MRFKVCAVLMLTLTLVAPLGCATVGLNPSAEDVAAVREIAQNASAGIRIGQGIATQAGDTLNALPIPAAAKNDYDCAIVRVNGTNGPRQSLLTACGPDTPQGDGPLVDTLRKLKTVGSRASLVETLTVAKGYVEPLIQKLEKSESQTLRAYGASLRFAFALVLSGGIQ